MACTLRAGPDVAMDAVMPSRIRIEGECGVPTFLGLGGVGEDLIPGTVTGLPEGPGGAEVRVRADIRGDIKRGDWVVLPTSIGSDSKNNRGLHPDAPWILVDGDRWRPLDPRPWPEPTRM